MTMRHLSSRPLSSSLLQDLSIDWDALFQLLLSSSSSISCILLLKIATEAAASILILPVPASVTKDDVSSRPELETIFGDMFAGPISIRESGQASS